jgi:ABC-2 type transport system permease protein
MNESGTRPGRFQWRRARAIAIKEVAHIARDPFTIAMALILPVVVVLIFGFAIEFNLNRIPTAVLDSDHSQSSRALRDAFGASDYFRLSPVLSPQAGWAALESEEAKAMIVIPPHFENDLLSGRGADVQVLIDAADNSAASSIMGYVGEVQRRANEKTLGAAPRELIEVKSRFLFNPELNSRWFIVPGLVVVVMSILSILLTALTIAREWESGSMELLLSTPVEPLEVIVGKLAPYAVMCLGAIAMVYGLARLVFGVPFVGSHLVFIAGCLVFLVTYLGQGLLISVVARKQTLAMQLAMMSGLLPSQLLSGFVFPIESMPVFFRYFTMLLPARWFMVIARDSFLKGAGFWELRVPFLALTISAVVFITVAVRKFKKDVEP